MSEPGVEQDAAFASHEPLRTPSTLRAQQVAQTLEATFLLRQELLQSLSDFDEIRRRRASARRQAGNTAFIGNGDDASGYLDEIGSSSGSGDESDMEEATDTPSVPPAPESTIAALRTARVSNREAGTSICCICHEDAHYGEMLIVLSCSHRFCRTCLVRWLRLCATCPTCRRVVDDSDCSRESEVVCSDDYGKIPRVATAPGPQARGDLCGSARETREHIDIAPARHMTRSEALGVASLLRPRTAPRAAAAATAGTGIASVPHEMTRATIGDLRPSSAAVAGQGHGTGGSLRTLPPPSSLSAATRHSPPTTITTTNSASTGRPATPSVLAGAAALVLRRRQRVESPSLSESGAPPLASGTRRSHASGCPMASRGVVLAGRRPQSASFSAGWGTAPVRLARTDSIGAGVSRHMQMGASATTPTRMVHPPPPRVAPHQQFSASVLPSFAAGPSVLRMGAGSREGVHSAASRSTMRPLNYLRQKQGPRSASISVTTPMVVEGSSRPASLATA